MAVALVAASPAAALATPSTVIVGPRSVTSTGMGTGSDHGYPPVTLIQTSLSYPSAVLAAPADGEIVSFRIPTSGNPIACHAPHVLRPGRVDGTFSGVGTGPCATNLSGAANVVNPGLPVRIGDQIGIDLISTETYAANIDYGYPAVGSDFGVWSPILGDFATPLAPESTRKSYQLEFNATVRLDPPVVSSITPSSGPPAGGTPVTITGAHLAKASEVRFDETSAPILTKSNRQITTTAPPGSLGTVDVTATTSGGTNATSAADRFTYANPGVAPPPDRIAPRVSRLAVAPAVFRAAGGRASAARRRRPPVGAHVGFRLSESSTITFTVTHRVSGRRRGHACVAPSRRLHRARRCTRTVALPGTLRHDGRSGGNGFRFAGRLRGRALSPGAYTLVARAVDRAHNRSSPVRARFRIVG